MTDKYEGTIRTDYEAAWNRQRVRLIELEEENNRLRNTIIGMCKSLFSEVQNNDR